MPSSTITRPDRSAGRGTRAPFLLTAALVAWGALAFGAPYRWAYVPLAAGSACLGALLLWTERRRGGPPAGTRAFLIALGTLVLAAGLQLVPLPPAVRERISPASTALLTAIDLPFAVQAAAPGGNPAWHPLSIGPAATLTGLGLLAAFTLLLAGLLSLFSRDGLTPAVRPILVFGLALACLGIVQKALLGDNVFTGMRIYGFWAPRYLLTTPFGPFVNKNHFAGWMLMAIPLGIGYSLGLADGALRHVRRGWRNRLLWLSSSAGGHLQLVLFAAMVMSVSLLMTKSRSGIGCFVVAVAMAGVVAAWHQRTWKSRALVLGALVGLAFVPLAWSGVDVAARFSAKGAHDESLGLRRAIWRDTLAIVGDFPLTGTGLNTFGIATARYQTALTDLTFREAHNDYLQVAAEGGLLLGIPALAAAIFFVRGVWRRFRERADDTLGYWLRFGAVTGVLAIALQSAVEFSLQMPGNAVLFVVLCAAALHRAPRVDAAARRVRP